MAKRGVRGVPAFICHHDNSAYASPILLFCFVCNNFYYKFVICYHLPHDRLCCMLVFALCYLDNIFYDILLIFLLSSAPVYFLRVPL